MTASAPAATAANGKPSASLLRLSNVAKAFGPTQALRDASFDLVAGEVHALVGENGSGKSTLMKIVSGVHSPDAGTIELAGEQISPLRTPRIAQGNGIATVFQEVLVAEARSVLENVWLGSDTPLKTRVGPREKRARASELLEELRGAPLPLDKLVEELPLSDRQTCCIVRALLRRPRILVLDEATSALDIATRDRLFTLMQRLSGDGVGIIFITHRMDEISQVGDRITVMRNGETVGTLDRGKWKPGDLVRMMTGADEREHLREPSQAAQQAELMLKARGLQLSPQGRPFDVEIRAGELVGVAGLEGHGQEDFLEALRGAEVYAGEVVRVENGNEVKLDSPAHAAKHGVVFVPGERGESMFRWMSIRENFGMPTLSRDSRFGWLRLSSTRRRLDQYVGQLKIVLRSSDDEITTLSGGNQQKVVVARWLAAQPRVLLLNDPTRGIDIGAKHDLYDLLARLAAEGVSVVMLSTEVDEQIELMDRVLVFHERELFAELPRAKLTRHALVSAFFGHSGEDKEGKDANGSD